MELAFYIVFIGYWIQMNWLLYSILRELRAPSTHSRTLRRKYDRKSI